MAYLSLGIGVLLTGVLLVAVLGKLGRRGGFTGLAGSLDAFGLRGRVARPAAAALLAAEAIAVVALWWPAGGRVGAVPAVLLFTAYTAGVAWTLHRRLAVDCACFGTSRDRLRGRHLARNAALLTVAATAAVLPAGGAVEAAPAAVAAVAGAVGAALFVFWEDLAAVMSGAPAPSNERNLP
ncbi:MauE/DoxX family redox-associated membrane protein [Catellatospora citrea]|uniref:MauE/DoxX family redox-associated membrane protein n=1 Tax=Catellatospora citrea TaxID=53366 RepID=UPI0033CB72C2